MRCPWGPGTALGLLGNQGDTASPGQAPLLTCPSHAHFRRWLKRQAGSWAGGWVPSATGLVPRKLQLQLGKGSSFWVPLVRPGGCPWPYQTGGRYDVWGRIPGRFRQKLNSNTLLSFPVGTPLYTHKRKPHPRCPAPSHLKGKVCFWFSSYLVIITRTMKVHGD